MPKYQQDKRNANRGTARGRAALKQSLERLGAGRSVLVDSNNVVIAGNKTMEAAEAIGLVDNAIVVETTGDKLVIVKRTDLNLEEDADGKAVAMSLADNRISELGLDWDLDILKDDLEMLQSDFLNDLWTPEEFSELFNDGSIDLEEAFEKLPTEDRPPFHQITFTLHDEQIADVKEAIKLAGGKSPSDSSNQNVNGNALHFICKGFLNGNR